MGCCGVVGIVFVYKIIGVVVEVGVFFEELKVFGEKVIVLVKMFGVVFILCIVFEVGYFGFEFGDDEIELGIGIYGEFGFMCEKIMLFVSLVK